MPELLDLPLEIVTLILSHSELNDLFSFGATCRRMRDTLQLKNLIWLVEHNKGIDRNERKQLIRNSSPLILSHVLQVLLLQDRDIWRPSNFDELCRHGASFKNVPHGRLLQQVFTKAGPGRRFRFMLRKGASLDQVEGGVNKLLEESLLRHGPGERTDYLFAHGASVRDVPGGLENLVGQLYKQNRMHRVDFILRHCPLASAPPSLVNRIINTYQREGWSSQLKHILHDSPEDLNILLGGLIVRGDFRITDLLQRGASLHRVPQLQGKPRQVFKSLYRHYGILEVVLQGADPNSADLRGPPLHAAAEEGLLEITRFLLEKGAALDRMHNGSTPLMVALRHAKLDVAKLLIQNGADVRIPNTSGETPLLLALGRKSTSVVKLLLQSGADTSGTDGSGCTSLHLAARLRDLGVANYLLAKGMDINLANSWDGETPLFDAVRYQNLEMVQLLLENGADPNLESRTSRYRCYVKSFYEFLAENSSDMTSPQRIQRKTPLMLASAYGSLELVKLLLAHGAKSNTSNAESTSSLEHALCHGHLDIVKFFYELDVDEKLMQGRKALQMAAYYGYHSIVEFLCEKGVKPTSDGTSASPLYLAAARGHTDVVEYLLEMGVDDRFGFGGYIPLVAAASKGHFNVVKLLISAGADPSLCSKDGRSAIVAATEHRHVDAVEFLAQSGAALEDKCGELGYTPLLIASDISFTTPGSTPPWAVSTGNFIRAKVAEVLLRHGAEINVVDSLNRTPLFHAASHDLTRLTKILLEQGANPNLANKDGMSPLDVAIANGCVGAANVLRQHQASSVSKQTLPDRPALLQQPRISQQSS